MFCRDNPRKCLSVLVILTTFFISFYLIVAYYSNQILGNPKSMVYKSIEHSEINFGANNFDQDYEGFLENSTYLQENSNSSKWKSLSLPDIFTFLPYLRDDPLSTTPAFIFGNGKRNASIILGVPTVKRESQSYLFRTLKSLIECMNQEEREKTLIIILIAEIDIKYVKMLSNQIMNKFKKWMLSGIMEIISPPASFYPDLDKLRLTLNDPTDRVKWRTKQNFDYAFLMMYAQSRAPYFVQLEDDIITTPGYINKMLDFVQAKGTGNFDWFILDFCQLGFIGKLFKSADLSYVIMFTIMFHNDQPVDWLLSPILEERFCNNNPKSCAKVRENMWIQHNPSLFQHVGITSSLKGKTQKLIDKQFPDGTLLSPTQYSNNPAATVSSTIKASDRSNIQNVYEGKGMFNGLKPKTGDEIVFQFEKPITLKDYRVQSGSYQYPSNVLFNTVVQLQSANNTNNTILNEYITVGRFDNELGLAEGMIDNQFNPISAVRLLVKSDSINNVIISEVIFETSTKEPEK